VHNDSVVHWEEARKRNRQEYNLLNAQKISSAITEFDNANGAYIDVHSWQFQPHTLSDILRVLIELDLIGFANVICYGPVFGRNEFCIELVK
jgi:hypothetical protein